MAGCKLCNLKFFTLPELLKDAFSAEIYLKQKFGEHKCSSLLEKWFQF